jgi:glutamate dehydrogenase (NAD(P)+)
MLRRPRRALEVSVPIRRDDGTLTTFVGYRVQHNRTRGPAKGGLRYDPRVTLEELSALAMTMTWKCALLGLPYGGGKGGVRCDPRQLSSAELERLTRRYVSELMPVLGPGRDILAPDIGTDERVMAWIADTYAMTAGAADDTSTTGKPALVGGSPVRARSTGAGVALCLRLAVERAGLRRPVRVAIAGYGGVGRAVAERLAPDDDYVIVGASDVSGARYSSAGLSPGRIGAALDAGSTMSEVEEGDPLDRDELLTAPCDVLVPASVSGVIDAGVAAELDAAIVVEGANCPTTTGADEILDQRGVAVVPDILANSGGVCGSWHEWVQNRQGISWPVEKLESALASQLRGAFGAVESEAESSGGSLREAAYRLAVGSVAQTHRLRGLYP